MYFSAAGITQGEVNNGDIFTPIAEKSYISCKNETPYSCITKAARIGRLSFPAEHLVPKAKVISHQIEHTKNLLWHRMAAIKNEAEDGAKVYSLDIASLPSNMKEVYHGELALILSKDNIIDTGIGRDKFKTVHIRAYYDGTSRINIGGGAHIYIPLYINIENKSVNILWKYGSMGGPSLSSWYTIPDELLNTWVDFVISLNATGIQIERVTANGAPLASSAQENTMNGMVGTFPKKFDRTAKIGLCSYEGHERYGNGRISKLDIYSSYMGPKNIANIVAGKKYNDGIPKYSKEMVQMYRNGDHIYGLYNGVTILPPSEANNKMWFHHSIPGIVETSKVCCGIQRPDFPNLIKRVQGNMFSSSANSVKDEYTEILGGFKDRLCYSDSHGIYKTITGLPPSSKVKIVMHILLIDSLDQSERWGHDRFTVEVGDKRLTISPSEVMHDQINAVDELIAVQPTITNLGRSDWQQYGYGLGETLASFAFDVDTDKNGSVFVRLIGHTDQNWDDESFGLAAVDVYEVKE